MTTCKFLALTAEEILILHISVLLQTDLAFVKNLITCENINSVHCLVEVNI